jgi:RNA polymerase sigma-70 factor (ECF subfamily)
LLDPLEYEDRELLLLITAGDQNAFAQLFNKYRRKVLFIASDLLHSKEAAEDVLQNVFTKLWVNREKATEINQFSAYLNIMVRNEVFNILRRKSYLDAFIEEHIGEESHELQIGEEFEERQRKFRMAVEQLTPQQRKVLELCGMEGYKQAEAAKLLGISTGTVKKHMADALRDVRKFLKGAMKMLFSLLLNFL